MNNYRKHLKNILKIIVGIVVGYFVYYFVLMDIVASFCSIDSRMYIVFSMFVLLCSVIAATVFLFLITKSKLHPIVYKVVVIIYVMLLILIFFGRPNLGRELSFDLIGSMKAVVGSRDAMLQWILNLLILMPVGYFFRNMKIRKSTICFLLISISIELIQYIFKRGVFDIFDIVCYCIGMVIGYYLCRKFKIQIMIGK